MDLLYVHQYYKEPNERGGTRSYEMARRLSADGVCVTIVAGTDEDEGSTRISPQGVRVVRIPVKYHNRMTSRQRYLAWLSFARQATSFGLSERFDVVFATSTPLSVAIPALALRRLKDCPFVFEVRDMWPDLPVSMGALKNPAARRFAYSLETAAYRHASHVVALSPGMQKSLISKGVPQTKISVIPNACDFHLFSPSDGGASFFRVNPHFRGKHLVVYAGTVGRANKVGYLAELAAHLRNEMVNILVVGDGNDLDNVRSQAVALGVHSRNMHFLPPIPKEAVPSLLSASTMVVSTLDSHPALQHSSPNKVFDAMAAGRPIAVNYGGWISDLIEQRKLGLALSADPESSARRLEEWLLDEQGIRDAGLQSARTGRELFDRDQHYQSLQKILREATK